MTLLDVPLEQFKRRQNPGWSNDKVEQLKTLCKKGLSSGQIAHKLGFATRNAVIGKMHRLGLVKTKQHGQRPEIQRKRFVGGTVKPHNVCPQVIHKAHYTQKKRLRISLVETPDSPPTAPVYIQPSKYDQSIPLEQRKTLLELNNLTCKWPCGDPQRPDFFFCGATTVHTYCPHHANRAYKA